MYGHQAVLLNEVLGFLEPQPFLPAIMCLVLIKHRLQPLGGLGRGRVQGLELGFECNKLGTGGILGVGEVFNAPGG